MDCRVGHGKHDELYIVAMDLTFLNIVVGVTVAGAAEKIILRGVSGRVEPGTMLALMVRYSVCTYSVCTPSCSFKCISPLP